MLPIRIKEISKMSILHPRPRATRSSFFRKFAWTVSGSTLIFFSVVGTSAAFLPGKNHHATAFNGIFGAFLLASGIWSLRYALAIPLDGAGMERRKSRQSRREQAVLDGTFGSRVRALFRWAITPAGLVAIILAALSAFIVPSELKILPVILLAASARRAL